MRWSSCFQHIRSLTRALLASRMGSVLAASSPNPPPPAPGGAAVPGLTVPPGFGMPPVSSIVSPSDAASGQQQEAGSTLPNPGAFDECHRKCKGKFFLNVKGLGTDSDNLLEAGPLYVVGFHSISCSLLRGFPHADGRRPARCQQGPQQSLSGQLGDYLLKS